MGLERRLCGDCSLLAEQDVELEGHRRELFACMTWEGFVPNKHRRRVQLLRRHRLSEISLLAEELLAEDDFQRQLSAARREHESEFLQQIELRYDNWLDGRVDRLGEETAFRFQ